MKKGQLIVNCLKLLNDNNGEDIDYETVSELPEYKERTTVIIPSINRALQRLAQLKKIPLVTLTVKYNVKTHKLEIKDGLLDPIEKDVDPNKYGSIEIDGSNILMINTVRFFDRHMNPYTNINYFMNGDKVILPPLGNEEQYIIEYRPILKDIKEDDLDIMDLNYPDYILDLVPYYVKGDLFEEDDPQLAILANNKFEALASQIPTRDRTVLHGVQDVYNLY